MINEPLIWIEKASNKAKEMAYEEIKEHFELKWNQTLINPDEIPC